jgi:hypothetical protein
MLNQLFLEAPIAMILIDPFNNKILKSNLLAQTMLSATFDELEVSTVSQFFTGCLQ